MDWLQWITSGTAVAALAGALATYIKTRPAMKTVQIQGETALWARIQALEAQAERSTDECDKRIERLEERNNTALAKMEAEIQILRHDRNNLRAALNAMFAMIKRLDNPELSSIAEAVEEMVTRGDQTIAIEKAAIPGMKGKL